MYTSSGEHGLYQSPRLDSRRALGWRPSYLIVGTWHSIRKVSINIMVVSLDRTYADTEVPIIATSSRRRTFLNIVWLQGDIVSLK